MKFSIIIPTYNRAELLKETISTVLQQTYADWELIVVDDGGQDGTEKLVDSFNDSRIKYVWKENEERGIARNFGLSKSSGEYIFYLDSDDLLLPNFLEDVKKVIDQEDSKWIFVDFDFFREGKKIKKKKTPKEKVDLSKLNYFGSGWVLRSDIAKENQFVHDPKFIIGEDWYVVLKLNQKHEPYIIEEPLRLVREHPERSMDYPSIELLEHCKNTLIDNLKSINIHIDVLKNVQKEMEYLILLSHTKHSNKSITLKYLLNYTRNYKSFIFSIRFFVIVKKLILG